MKNQIFILSLIIGLGIPLVASGNSFAAGNAQQAWTPAVKRLVSSTSSLSASGIIQKTYLSREAALNDLNQLQTESIGNVASSGHDINLGFGISSQYSRLGQTPFQYQWQEGRWTIVTQFWTNTPGGFGVAKNMVSYLHTHMLPVPQNKGIIVAVQPRTSKSADHLITTIAWQEGNKVYQSQRTGDPVKALQVVVNNRSIPSTSQSTQSVSSFPPIVNMAMKQFPANVLNQPKAPTVLPISDLGSKEMYYRTSDSATGSILSYQVILSSPHNLLAAFSGSTYSGIPSGNAIFLPNGIPTNGHVKSSSVHLSNGIVANEQIFVAPKYSVQETSLNLLKWKEGRWQIEVSRTQSVKAPIAEADAVVSYLFTHFMPVPETKGTIYVNVYPGENAQGQLSGTSVSETIKWQEGSHVYEIDTYSHVKKTIQTGLAMVISMKPYTTKSTTASNVIVHSYASVGRATNAIDSIQQRFGNPFNSSDPNPNLNLGNGISVEQAGALGSLYLKWTEGRWTILAQLAGPDAVTQAKQMVSYLHTHMLPVPQNKGVISVIQSLNSTLYSRTTVAWQVGTKVYEIQQTGDPVSALRIAVNTSVG